MAEQNQKQTQEKSLEDKLLQIGNLHQISRDIENSKKYRERYSLYRALAGELSEGDLKRYKEAYRDIRVSPEEAIRYSLEGLGNRAKKAEPQYKEKKKEILENLVSTINKDLKGAKDGHEASTILSHYLTGLYETPELDQITADEYAQEDAAESLGVSMNFSARGHIEHYREKHESLYARIYASQYLKEITQGKGKNKKVIGYELDKEKIAKLADNIVNTAVIYRNAKIIAEYKTKQKEAEKAKK